MRAIINISVPLATKKEVEREVKLGGYSSVSELFRAILRERKKYAFLHEVTESRHEFAHAKGKLLTSLSELD